MYTTNYLEFRTLNDEEMYYGERHRAGEEVELVEEIGFVETSPGKILFWDNDLQHKVGPLAVSAIESTAGIRKIDLVFLSRLSKETNCLHKDLIGSCHEASSEPHE
jgi:hypothetical protein